MVGDTDEPRELAHGCVNVQGVELLEHDDVHLRGWEAAQPMLQQVRVQAFLDEGLAFTLGPPRGANVGAIAQQQGYVMALAHASSTA